MASRYLRIAATSADVLATEEIRLVSRPSSVSLWASSVTKGDTIGLQHGSNIIMDEGQMNIEISADVVDTTRDQLVFGTLVGAGLNLRIPVGTLTTELQLLLVVQPVA